MQVPNIPTPAPVLPTPPAPPIGPGPGFSSRLTALLGSAEVAGTPSGGHVTADHDHGVTRGIGTAARGAVTLGQMLRAGGAVMPATQSTTGLAAMQGPGPLTAAGVAAPHERALAVEGGPFAGHVATVAPVEGTLTSSFGPRVHPITGAHKDHDGIDYGAPTGTPVRAVTGGEVIAAGTRGGYGLTVEVDHGNGTTTRYAHLSAIDVEVGDQLPIGGELGAVGSTGASTGPHLHVEVRVDGEPVDPHGLW